MDTFDVRNNLWIFDILENSLGLGSVSVIAAAIVIGVAPTRARVRVWAASIPVQGVSLYNDAQAYLDPPIS